MRLTTCVIAVLLMSTGLSSQVVINEFVYDDQGSDDREFVELYNASGSAIDISNWTLESVDDTGLAVGSPHTIPASTLLAAGDWYVIGSGLVPNVDLVVANGFLEDDKEGLILKDAGSLIVDAVGYEGNKTAILPAGSFEGTPIWGNFRSQDNTLPSWSRWIDGLDSNDNGADFGQRPASPGATNNLASLLPYCDEFEGRPLESAVAGWNASFAFPRIVDPTTASNSIVNPVPPSPEGGNVMVMWDPNGGGNSAFLDTEAVPDLDLECYVYIWAGETGSEYQAWSIGIRGTTGTFYNTPQLGTANGNTGVAWRYYSDGLTATLGGVHFLELVDEGPGGAPSILATVPIVPGTNDGWQRLRLSVSGGNISANFSGVYGDPGSGMTFSFPTATAQFGSAYLGYRESVAGVLTAYPLMLDRLEITNAAAGPCVSEFQKNQFASSLDLDGIQGGRYNRAISQRCFNSQGIISFASTNVGLPYDAAISFEALVSASGGGLATANGQIVNVNFATPILPLVWLNGGVAPNVATSSFPAPSFTGVYTAFATPGSASIQMGVFDPTNPDLFALSQGSQVDILGSTTITHVLGDDTADQVFLGGAAPLCATNIPFYGTSYTTCFVVSNGRVMFGGADTDWSASVADALVDNPFIGVWADLSPQVAGSVTTTQTPSGNVRVDFTGIPYFQQPAATNTFAFEFNTTTGDICLETTTVVTDPTPQNMFIGLSAGLTVTATDPGPVAFGPAPAAGLTTNGTDMIYEFGPSGSLATGVSKITLTPNAFTNYDWSSQ